MQEIKEVVWIGSSLDDLRDMPEDVQDDTGFILDRVQRGLFHHNIKPLKGLSGVQEIRIDFDKDTYRTVYALKLADRIYVLHVFKKKSKQGIKTPKQDTDVIKERLKRAKELADEREKDGSRASPNERKKET
jgi:phage-related protein